MLFKVLRMSSRILIKIMMAEIITQEKHPFVTNPVKSKSLPGSRQKKIYITGLSCILYLP